MPRASSICSVEKCLNVIPCPTHKRKPFQGSARNINRPKDWRKRRSLILRRDGFACVLCGSSGPLEVDHILSVARGGSWELANLQALCAVCHKAKTIAENRQT